MRTAPDRLRHAISFEVIGLILVIPLGAMGFGIHAGDVGVIAVVGATIATFWNYAFNLMFDHGLLRMRGRLDKRLSERVLHALLFELGLLVATLPLIAWYLSVSLMDALILDLALVVFYLVYAFVFNWAYDRIFPIPTDPGAIPPQRPGLSQ
ncbi:PACE efflux transporter [Falsirhodobacter halotolerans]|uniref:PACE efflux transporter n=1 Tax=Falsirhodobacter halotolerans TaxID=1146892 RepID=UPI001FD608FD|nr:PACE efflux transporter [Falsirhodobacter halotolerans]MCJ8139325.1 PACE efflux transporter [Falsirhodobacter halotolerans]